MLSMNSPAMREAAFPLRMSATMASRASSRLFERRPEGDGIVKDPRWAMEMMRMRQVVQTAEDEKAERPRVHRALDDAMALWRTWRDVADRVAVITGREGAG